MIKLIPLAFILVACQKEIGEDELKSFFKKNKAGMSPDYALMKYGTDYVATIHGYGSDLEGCTQIAEALEEMYKNDYRCVPLNK